MHGSIKAGGQSSVRIFDIGFDEKRARGGVERIRRARDLALEAAARKLRHIERCFHPWLKLQRYVLRNVHPNAQNIIVRNGEHRRPRGRVGRDKAAYVDIPLRYYPIERRYHALIGLQPFEPGDLGFLRLNIGLGHVHSGILRGQIVLVLIAGLLGLPPLLHQGREAVVGGIGKPAVRFRLLKRCHHLLKLRAGLRELIVHLGRGDQSQKVASLHPASDIHEPLVDIPALPCINRSGVEGFRRGGKVELPRSGDGGDLLDPEARGRD